MVSRVIPVDPFDLVIFGGTGDLARRKILPGLFRRFRSGQMPDGARIIAAARSELDRAGYQQMISDAIQEFGGAEKDDTEAVAKFLEVLDYTPIDAKGEGGWKALSKMVRKDVIQAFYFSVAPSLFGDLAQRLHDYKIANAESRIEWVRAYIKELAHHHFGLQ